MLLQLNIRCQISAQCSYPIKLYIKHSLFTDSRVGENINTFRKQEHHIEKRERMKISRNFSSHLNVLNVSAVYEKYINIYCTKYLHS